MKTFYSIIFVNIRPNLGEKVSIGLLMSDENRGYLEFSEEKLQFLKHLVLPEAFNLISTGLKSFSTLMCECAYENVVSGFKGRDYLKESYFSYLSRYANDLLTYSQPTTIDVAYKRETFDKLFEKYVYHLPGVNLYKGHLSYQVLIRERDQWMEKYEEQTESYQQLSDLYIKLLEEKLGLKCKN